MEEMYRYWQQRWPAAFATPVPLALGFSGQMKAALRDEGTTFNRKMFGIAIDAWTKQGAYLRAIIRGDVRRNLDGSEAGIPDEISRIEAQRILDERAARQLAQKQTHNAQQACLVLGATNRPTLQTC
jgi:sRNA-binding protein